MTDRELLEMAAKAADITLELGGNPEEWMPMYYEGKTYHEWNPLERDDLALRLAVKLYLHVLVDDGFSESIGDWKSVIEAHDGDSYAATRRAIVRAAAEIGKAM